MTTHRVPLSDQEEAHLALVLELYTMELKRLDEMRAEAEKRRSERLGPLTRGKGIPEGTRIDVHARKEDQPAFLVYDTPDIVSREPLPQPPLIVE